MGRPKCKTCLSRSPGGWPSASRPVVASGSPRAWPSARPRASRSAGSPALPTGSRGSAQAMWPAGSESARQQDDGPVSADVASCRPSRVHKIAGLHVDPSKFGPEARTWRARVRQRCPDASKEVRGALNHVSLDIQGRPSADLQVVGQRKDSAVVGEHPADERLKIGERCERMLLLQPLSIFGTETCVRPHGKSVVRLPDQGEQHLTPCSRLEGTSRRDVVLMPHVDRVNVS